MRDFMKARIKDEQGKVIAYHYYQYGTHIFEFPRGRGIPRARVAFQETPRGRGKVLWEEHGGLDLYKVHRPLLPY